MKIFISWSGEASHAVAIALRDWLPSVLQAVEPYVSSEDIEKGARWNAEIAQQLNNTEFGIVCVTRSNVGSPWLNFEAGALSKSVDTSHVSPFLLEFRPAELVGPLAQFQATLPQFDDVARLVKSINSASERPIDEARLAKTLAVWWPSLEEQLQAVLSEQGPPQPEPQRDTREMIEELLEISRGIQGRIVRARVGEPRIHVEEYDRRLVEERHRLFDRIVADVEDALLIDSLYPEMMSITSDTVHLSLPRAPSGALTALLESVAERHGITLNVSVPGERLVESGDDAE